jgi:hypothetical protein
MRPVTAPKNRILSIEELDHGICTLSRNIDQATYELLVLVREFDERAGWLKWELSNCTEWLQYRCDLSKSAAREKVRVAHALKQLPLIAEAFSNGELSYSKVQSLTRVAGCRNEAELVNFAVATTARVVQERCRELRCGTAESVGEAYRAHANRSLSIRRDANRGMMTITVELPLETGELLEKALDRARDNTPSQTPEVANESWSALQADALITVANTFLSDGSDQSTGSSDNYQVTIHVDRSALAEGDGRSSLPIESVKRLCCDGDAVVIVENEEGEPLSVGRKTRTVSTAIKRALSARDKGCRFPGCHHTRFVDAHHIIHWSAGVETSLDNLMLLCSRHHRLVHEGGISIERDFQNRWFFKRPDGIAVPGCGYLEQDQIDDDIGDTISNLSNAVKNPLRQGFVASLKTSLVAPPI